MAGEEVALPSNVPTHIDEDPASLDDLRAGQVVAIEASGQGDALQARRIVVRHAVIGPIEATGPGTMTVAGQLVATPGATGAAVNAKPGLWVAVSGLRSGNGVITATRIDPASPGLILVRGELVRIYGSARVGSLPVQLPPDTNLPAGWPVTVTGRMQGGVLVADSATLDVASESPSAYFGPSVSNFVVESAVAVLAGGYVVEHDVVSGHNFGQTGTRDRAIARYARGPAGLVATGLQFHGTPAGGAGTFTPAPTVSGGNSGASGGSARGGIPTSNMPGGGLSGAAGSFAPFGLGTGFGGGTGGAGPAAPGMSPAAGLPGRR